MAIINLDPHSRENFLSLRVWTTLLNFILPRFINFLTNLIFSLELSKSELVKMPHTLITQSSVGRHLIDGTICYCS